MCGPEDPLFMPLLQFATVPFQAKVSVHKAPFWENLEILASTASIFAQILALKPPNLEIFSSQALKLENFQFTSPKFGNFQLTSPPFQRQVLVRKPLTSEIRAAHPYLKKVECPPPGPGFPVVVSQLCKNSGLNCLFLINVVPICLCMYGQDNLLGGQWEGLIYWVGKLIYWVGKCPPN